MDYLLSNATFLLGRPHPALSLIIFLLYFLPTIVAVLRGHPQAIPIVILNFFLGWTFIGWVVALVWATLRLPPRTA